MIAGTPSATEGPRLRKKSERRLTDWMARTRSWRPGGTALESESRWRRTRSTSWSSRSANC